MRFIERYAIATLIILGFVAWLNPSTFLWRDDWTYLSYFLQGRFKLFNGNPAFEIKPLFQYLLFAEFYFFKTYFWAYQLINAALLILFSLVFFKWLLLFEIPRTWALFLSGFLLLHPTNFVNAFWIFQQCELAHLLLLMSACVCLKLFLTQKSTGAFALFSILLFLQHFFFPNGLFYPILMLIGSFVFKASKSQAVSISATCTIVFIFFIAHAAFLQGKMQGTSLLHNDITLKLAYLARLITTSFIRLGFFNFSSSSNNLFNISFLIAVAALLVTTFKKLPTASRALTLFAVAGLLLSSLTLAMTRYQQPEIHYYYTTLHLPFLVMMLGAYSTILKFNFLRWQTVAGTITIIALLTVDFAARKIFSSRNKANQQQMELAKKTGQYAPADDPFFLPNNYDFFNAGNEEEATLAVKFFHQLSQE